jgi:hypothetical protein
MNENQFSLGGITYEAIEGYACESCAFKYDNCKRMIENFIMPSCITEDRKDGRQVYWERQML